MKLTQITTLIAPLLATHIAFAGPVPNAKAAELSLHRIERLVILKKIDSTFETAVHTLKLERLAHQTPDQPSFESTVTEYPAADGSSRNVAIPMDESGKALGFTQSAGSNPAAAPNWPVVDAVTLAENCFHYLEDNYTSKPELLPYYNNVSLLTLTQGTDSTGATVAIGTMEATAADPVLKVILKTDGTVQSDQIIPRSILFEVFDNAPATLEPSFDSISKNIFVPMCVQCHKLDGTGEGKDVILTDYKALLGSARDLVLPGDSEASGLVIAVSRTDKKMMPPAKSGEPHLTDDQIAVIKKWIDTGAQRAR